MCQSVCPCLCEHVHMEGVHTEAEKEPGMHLPDVSVGCPACYLHAGILATVPQALFNTEPPLQSHTQGFEIILQRKHEAIASHAAYEQTEA